MSSVDVHKCDTHSILVHTHKYKIRWWDMDKNQLYRDFSNARGMADKAFKNADAKVTQAATKSTAKAAKDAATVGMSREKVQQAHTR